jgi:hypothetical protein
MSPFPILRKLVYRLFKTKKQHCQYCESIPSKKKFRYPAATAFIIPGARGRKEIHPIMKIEVIE